MEARKKRLTLPPFQRRLKVWRSRASSCPGAVKPPSTGRLTKGEADARSSTALCAIANNMLGAPSGRYAVRPRLRARGFSSRAGRQGQSGPIGLPGCLARTRSSRCRGGSANSGWRGCPAPPVSPLGKPRAIPAESREVARLGLNSWPVVSRYRWRPPPVRHGKSLPWISISTPRLTMFHTSEGISPLSWFFTEVQAYQVL